MKKYLAAVSGGPDSMALLYKYRKKIAVVCSINYNKRENSFLDNQLVETFCQQHHITFCLLDVTPDMYEQIHSNNFQEVARIIRYNFFEQIAQQYQIFNLLVAHQETDHLETAFMQQERNSLALYYGMKKKSEYHNLKIFRPLLKYSKQALEEFCQRKKIPYAIDYTNDLDMYERNRVRKIIQGWSKQELQTFKKTIALYNRTHSQLLKQVEKSFTEWEFRHFSYTYFKNISDEQIKYHLLYNLLSLHDESNISKNKINQIMDFLKIKNKKHYRLENNKFLMVDNDTIKVKKNMSKE